MASQEVPTLDLFHRPSHNLPHENGYLHYLPEDYSLAQSWPGRFRLPNVLMFVLARVLNRFAGGSDVLWHHDRKRG